MKQAHPKRKRLYACRAAVMAAAGAACAALPTQTFAVVFSDTGDPAVNTTAPTGTLLNSGWQLQGNWLGAFTGTPIGTHYFITAQHVRGGGDIGQALILNNTAYTTTLFP